MTTSLQEAPLFVRGGGDEFIDPDANMDNLDEYEVTLPSYCEATSSVITQLRKAAVGGYAYIQL